MKLVIKKKIVNQKKQTTNESNTYWSHLNASRAARNSFVDRMFVTPDLVSHAHPSQEGSWVNPVFPNHFRLVSPHRIQITCGTQWRTHSNFLKNPLSPACATFLVKLCNPITRQAIELESCSNPLRIQQVLWSKSKKQFSVSVGVFWRICHKRTCFGKVGHIWPALGPNPLTHSFGTNVCWNLGENSRL